MAFPILEGVQLLHAARGLLHELKGIGKSNPANKAVTIGSNDFASLLKAAQAASSSDSATKETTAVAGDRFTNLPTNLAARLEEEIAKFREELTSLFEQLPIDNLPELVLGTDSEGNVTVMNDHPDKEQIDALFKAHPMLSNAFSRLAVNASLVRTYAVQFPFAVGYLRDPQGAVMDVGASLSGANSPQNFRLTIGPSGVLTSFEGSSTTDGETAA
ncbi:MAG: hypothetical protein IT365_06750 [Candidatus Hydrogenedentes bacterium]|nr:hypothetical protein [Candidatus Hydrogenedentota bacterium]